MENQNLVISIPTNLVSRLGLFKGMRKLARIWLPLRQYDIDHQQGSGHIELQLATWLLCNPDSDWKIANSIKPVLEHGDGIFWEFVGSKIRLYSPNRVADKLGLDYPGSHVTIIPLEQFKEMRSVRAAFFCSFLNMIDSPISQEKLYEITGVPISSQKRYRKIIGIGHVAQYAIFKHNGKPVMYHPELARYISEFRNCFRNKSGYLATVIPNSYRKAFDERFSKRQTKTGRPSEKCGAGTKPEIIRVFYGTREKDDDQPRDNLIKYYCEHDMRKEQSEYNSLRDVFGKDILPQHRVWTAVLPYAGWSSIS